MSDYPVGAKWQGMSPDGRVATIWLVERRPLMEIWNWNVKFPEDASSMERDWALSKRMAIKDIRHNVAGFFDARFVRVKGT